MYTYNFYVGFEFESSKKWKYGIVCRNKWHFLDLREIVLWILTFLGFLCGIIEAINVNREKR